MDNVDNKIWDIAYNLFIKDTICHNHPPSTEFVNGCLYCETFGNVFAHGKVKVSDVNVPQLHALKINTKFINTNE